ncbi:HEAT repeat domain-containing protein [Alteriqipengyuania sp. WL0013]|uniref:HEAT repeat domain-containing protein n=1 Tax=Alteriqipengyuania sp. WL0013 TaxID=3110773 RepID=UPI002CD6DA15|nr:HEAT repeat domain-containing protein [Alteriqipengyuania sp. WL0013]MEB3416797.1 HEAT repeat domain-containing protein [Alteriqipengyuania sp. WL0013]
MKSLLALWELSLALCAVAAAALLVLVIARMVSLRAARRQEAIRSKLLPQLLAGDGEVGRLKGRKLRMAAALVSELSELTRGEDRDVLLARASDMGVPDLLLARLQSRSAQIRLSSVEALALFDQCTAETVTALDDDNPDVRLAAALALAHREEGPSARQLVEKLQMGAVENSLLLASLMGDLVQRNPGEVAALLFDKDVPVEAKVAATDALADGGGEYAPLLAYMAKESVGEPELQPRIFRALGRNGHPAGLDAIRQGLHSENWTVRAAASEAAGKLGASDMAVRIAALLADEHWWVRYRAGEALLRFGPRGIAELRAASVHADDTVRQTAMAMMAEGRAA